VSFREPLWLAAGALAVAALLAFWRRADRVRERDLARFASARLVGDLAASLSRTRRSAKRALVAGAVALAFAALAGPEIGFRWEETRRRGIDVLVALDVSRSMLARDVAPDRLTRAKLAITDLAEQLPGDRLGLIAFAGSAFLQCPLTLDHAAFQEALDALEPGVIPVPGSDLASALAVADDALRSEKRNVKLLVLVSDGEDLGGGAVAAAKRVAAEGVRVYTVGVGSAAGELVPATRDARGNDFVKDEAGRYVKSRLDEETLEKVAEATGGFYEPLGPRGDAMAAIAERVIRPIPKEELAARMRRVPEDRFQWPLLGAIALLALELLVGERRREAGWRWPRRAAVRDAATRASALLVVLGAAALLATAAPGRALASAASAQQLFDAGDFERALSEYRAAAESADDPRLDFNVGAAAYKAGRFDEAAAAFARALRSESPELQEKAFYNLGNAHFRLGAAHVEEAPEKASQSWQQALEAYEQALALAREKPDDDARHNRDAVRAALEELERQRQQQQEKQPGQKGGSPAGGKQQGKDEAGGDEHRSGMNDRPGSSPSQADARPPEGDRGSDAGDSARSPAPGAGGESGEREPKDGSPSAGGDANAPSPGAEDAGQPSAGEKRDDGAPRGETASGGAPPDDRARDRASAASGSDRPRSNAQPNDRQGASDGARARGDGETPHGDITAANGGASGQGSSSANASSGARGAIGAQGELSAADARELLDSLRGEERRVPLVAGGGAGAPPAGERAVRDW